MTEKSSKYRDRGDTLGRESYQNNSNVRRLSIYIDNEIDLKITTIANKKRVHKSELFNQILRLGLEKNDKKEIENANAK